ncbi:MAG: 3-methyl-2-oxobutanoate dehydrogenase (2-methylpropanoyl-transferring) subunit alpha [Xanthomonadales bacterium]|jgi:2-oxoisovalerate dehydrogenase E1 component alpha subunit|nr:3-methyl-2-oxobutanoate dehydrogenase (2-methylpropanoyl-transferring) subunit alpha [Xanthomonadales bacterium]
MSKQPYLHIPRPTARPGEAPDFSYLNLSPAGAVERPPIDARAGEIEYLALGLVRVLDDDHVAQGPWDPNLDKDTLVRALRLMVLTRAYDDRMQRMQRQGKITFYMQALGEEAVSIGQGLAFEDGDMMFPAYRNQGLYIMRDTGLVEMMCQCLSNSRDMCKGRQMPIFYQNAKKNLFTISGNLATQYPHAVGWAMGAAIKGEPNIAASWVGDGSTAEADFHYALTFAAVYNAPVILNVTNNQWAISTFQGFAGGDRRPFAARGLGLGMPGIRVDGNDLLAVYAATRWAADRARNQGGPTLIELVTYRGGAHSTSDDPSRYRPKDEWSSFPLGDPVDRLKQHLVKLGHWSEEEQTSLEEEMKATVSEAWKEAVSYGTLTEPPFLDVSLMFEDVFAEMPDHLARQREKLLRMRGERS